MNAVQFCREHYTPSRLRPRARARCNASQSTNAPSRKPPAVATLNHSIEMRPAQRFARLQWVAFWLSIATALAGLGFVIGTYLESGLLGFLGADFVFLIVVSFFTAGQTGSHKARA